MAAVTSIPRTTLRRIPLGSAKDVFVTDVCLGTMTWGVQNTEAEAHEQLDYAIKQRGVNFIDTYHRSGLYPVELPFVPGSEGAGIVEAVGADVTDVFVDGQEIVRNREILTVDHNEVSRETQSRAENIWARAEKIF